MAESTQADETPVENRRSRRIRFDMKPVTTEGCTYSFSQVIENLLTFVPPDSVVDNVGEQVQLLKKHQGQKIVTVHWIIEVKQHGRELATVIYTDLELIVDFNQKVLKGRAILTIERKPSTNEIVSRYRCNIQIEYKTSPASPALYWLTPEQTADGRHPFLLSNNKLIYARAWFPCQDTPSVKFKYYAKISVQKNFSVLMSALLQKMNVGPELAVYEFHQKKPVPSYAVIIAVGSLLTIKLDARINIFAERNLIFTERSLIFARNILKLRRPAQLMLMAAENLCGPYLWDKYDICVLPLSIAHFEIECPCVTFISPTLLGGDISYLSSLIARNISQSWAGNLVTCSNYQHLWLNKSFSIFICRKIKCTMYLNYEDLYKFFQREGLKNLSSMVDKFENTGLVKCLIPNLTDMSPHKATKCVPYEWGCALLDHLESIFLCSSQILDRVKWYSWFFNITPSLIVPRVSILEVQCFRLAANWEPENSDIVNNINFQLSEFCDVKRIIFLNFQHTLNTHLTKEELESIIPGFAFNIRNVEIRFIWLLLCIKVRWAEKVESALKFAIKFCFPNCVCVIFQSLYEWTEMRPVVIETLNDRRQLDSQ
ncbi:leukotriene A-4 hydrolase-like [Temnothorax longispinosus]|uniref:leukotriene A-4 hydrolase-like n=1 Tax=Temnothorax longispinosus TaxID=300112 RepID=UPI003A99E18E